MKLTELQLEAAGYLFEKANGNKHDNSLEKIIHESGLEVYDITILEKIIVNGINSEIYNELQIRTSAYWALSKRFNNELIPSFKKWLKMEIEKNNTSPIFQIMIALDNLEESIFNKDRTGYAFDEIELNLKDAKTYLSN